MTYNIKLQKKEILLKYNSLNCISKSIIRPDTRWPSLKNHGIAIVNARSLSVSFFPQGCIEPAVAKVENTAEGEDEREGESLAGSGPLKYSCVRRGGVGWFSIRRGERNMAKRGRLVEGETRERRGKRNLCRTDRRNGEMDFFERG